MKIRCHPCGPDPVGEEPRGRPEVMAWSEVLSLNLIRKTKNSSHAGSAPPTVVFGGIGGEYGTLGAITGWKRR
jgi:hypothetical protein